MGGGLPSGLEHEPITVTGSQGKGNGCKHGHHMVFWNIPVAALVCFIGKFGSHTCFSTQLHAPRWFSGLLNNIIVSSRSYNDFYLWSSCCLQPHWQRRPWELWRHDDVFCFDGLPTFEVSKHCNMYASGVTCEMYTKECFSKIQWYSILQLHINFERLLR